jgi:hypothetical protein
MSKATDRWDFEHMRSIKEKYEVELLRKANVVSVGIGLPIREGKPVGTPGIVVGVTEKCSPQDLAPEDLIPHMLEDVRVWVEEVGGLKAQK